MTGDRSLRLVTARELAESQSGVVHAWTSSGTGPPLMGGHRITRAAFEGELTRIVTDNPVFRIDCIEALHGARTGSVPRTTGKRLLAARSPSAVASAVSEVVHSLLELGEFPTHDVHPQVSGTGVQWQILRHVGLAEAVVELRRSSLPLRYPAAEPGFRFRTAEDDLLDWSPLVRAVCLAADAKDNTVRKELRDTAHLIFLWQSRNGGDIPANEVILLSRGAHDIAADLDA